MDLVEAINKRKTTRGFVPDPVPQEILREIMTFALRAPSWGNTQPWEFAIASGKTLEQIKQGFADKADEEPSPDLPFPRSFPEHILSRLPGGPRAPANRDDRELRRERQLEGSKLYGAPCAIYIYIDRKIFEQEGYHNVYTIFDCGLIAENIMLLAVERGLGTVAAAASVRCPDVLRKILGIPDTKLIVLGILIGYPDQDHPQFRVYSPREPLDKIARWYGFN